MKTKDRTSLSNTCIIAIIVLLYNLFALSRIKYFCGPTVENIKVSNIVYIYIISLILMFILKYKKKKMYIKEEKNIFFILIFIYLLVIIIGGLKINSIAQYIYAIVMFILPIFFYFSLQEYDSKNIILLIKLLIIINLLYGILTIIASLNYESIIGFIGGNLRKQYTRQYRASMMLGSSITVSYYMNLTLPMCLYMLFTTVEKKWKRISLTAIIVNIVATIMLLSRLAVVCLLCIIFYTIIFMGYKNKKIILKKILIVISLIISFVYLFNELNLDRLFIGFKEDSTEKRLEAISLGYEIFQDNYIIGSGMGKYFTRAYENRFINYNGSIGLVDTHNAYMMCLSETGITGLTLLITIFIYLLKKMTTIKDKMFMKTAIITILVFLLQEMGGSDIFNSMEYSMIFWFYMSIFKLGTISKEEHIIEKDT